MAQSQTPGRIRYVSMMPHMATFREGLFAVKVPVVEAAAGNRIGEGEYYDASGDSATRTAWGAGVMPPGHHFRRMPSIYPRFDSTNCESREVWLLANGRSLFDLARYERYQSASLNVRFGPNGATPP